MRNVLFILGQLRDEDIEWMIAAGVPRRVPAGGILIREGQPVDALYIVLEGALTVTAAAAPGKELARHGAGEIIGEISFVDSRPPSATVTAATETVVLALDRARLRDRLGRDPSFAAGFYRAVAVFLADRVRNTMNRMGYSAEHEMDEATEYQGELDLDVLDNVHLAGARFEHILKRLAGTV